MQTLALVPSASSVKTLRLAGKLTDRQLANAKPLDKPYKLSDANGMYLLVNATGSKLWRWKYTYGGKEKLYAIGTYPLVSLADARAKRDACRRLLASGVDPMAEKKSTKLALILACENTFESVAKDWWDIWKEGQSEQHAGQVWRRFQANVFPHIGKKPVSQLTQLEVVAMVKAIHRRGVTDLAKRALMTCKQVFRYAKQTGLSSTNPTTDIKLSDILPKTNSEHLARIDIKELPDLLRSIEAYRGTPTTRLAMKFMC